MIAAIAKFISALLDLPGLWRRFREHRKDKKIARLEVDIEKNRAKVTADHLHEEFVVKREITRKKIEDDTDSQTLDTIADYFSNFK